MKPTNLNLTEILKALENFDLDAAPCFGGPTELNSIYTYSRARAIEDGVLIDVTKQAKEIGIRFPTALTAGLWAETVAASDETQPGGTGAEDARLMPVLEMAISKLEDSRQKCVRFAFPSAREAKELEIMAAISPGDDGREVLTVMFPHED